MCFMYLFNREERRGERRTAVSQIYFDLYLSFCSSCPSWLPAQLQVQKAFSCLGLPVSSFPSEPCSLHGRDSQPPSSTIPPHHQPCLLLLSHHRSSLHPLLLSDLCTNAALFFSQSRSLFFLLPVCLAPSSCYSFSNESFLNSRFLWFRSGFSVALLLPFGAPRRYLCLSGRKLALENGQDINHSTNVVPPPLTHTVTYSVYTPTHTPP